MKDNMDIPDSIQKRADRLAEQIEFLGCNLNRFEKTGRTQLEVLIRHGLNPWSRLLDIGCGALSGGYWIMHFLDSGCYFGIEPATAMFEAGVAILPEPDLFKLKSPRFDHNDQYDFSVFGEKFDFFHAHSIWTHAPKKDLEKMLDGMVQFGRNGARFITSIKVPDLTHRDYKGDAWVGESHESNIKGIVRHSFKWIQQACADRGLDVVYLKGEKIHKQKWIRIDKNF